MLNRRLNDLLSLFIDGHLWIALASVCLLLSTKKIFGLTAEAITPLSGFLFAGTLTIYGVHSLFGKKGYESINQLITLLAFPFSIFFYWLLPGDLQIDLILPMLVSIAYISPLFKHRKRLRDFPMIKIFLVAFAWTILSTSLPVWTLQEFIDYQMFTFSAERLLFIFAITIPFDIRDMEKDGKAELITIPLRYGVNTSKNIAFVCLAISALLATFHWEMGWFSIGTWIAETSGVALSFLLVTNSYPLKHKWYYTGLVDGIMVLQPLLILVLP